MTRMIILAQRRQVRAKGPWPPKPPPMTACWFESPTVAGGAVTTSDARPNVAFQPIEIGVADGPPIHVMHARHVQKDGAEKPIDEDTIILPGESVSVQIANASGEPTKFYATLWGYEIQT